MKRNGVVLGLVLAAVAQFLAFMLAGAGHGWTAPFFVSAALWILIPATLWMASIANGNRPLMLSIAAVTVAADTWLITRSIDESSYISRYVDINGALGILIILLWLGLWSFWQPLLVHAFFAGRETLRGTND